MNINDNQPVIKIALNQIPKNSFQICENVIVVNLDDNFYAVENTCSHQKIPLNPSEIVNSEEFECAKHGARFNIKSGMPTCLPAVKPIKTYTTKIEDGLILVFE